MNKNQAKILAETITDEQLKEMFENAKEKITDWKAPSKVNKSMTIGVTWNILYGAFNSKGYKKSPLSSKNMLHEFGDYLSSEVAKPVKIKHPQPERVHQEPKF